MLGWFGKLFGRWSGDFRPKERLIFRFWNGERWVHADPLILYKRVSDKITQIGLDIKLSRSASKDADQAHANAVAAIRDLFNLKHPPAGSIECEGTLSQIGALELFEEFLDYCETLKKNTRRSATSPTVPSPPTPPLWGDGPATKSSPASGSTAAASSTAAPESPPTEPPSPSVS